MKPEIMPFFVAVVVPPYTTAMTPNVAKDTATNRRVSHCNLKSLTLIRYAKKALVFHIASNQGLDNNFLFHILRKLACYIAYSEKRIQIFYKDLLTCRMEKKQTDEASETATNHNNAGIVIPTVRTIASRKNL